MAKLGSKLGFDTLISLQVVLRDLVVEIAGAGRFGFLFDHLELYKKSCTVPGLMMMSVDDRFDCRASRAYFTQFHDTFE